MNQDGRLNTHKLLRNLDEYEQENIIAGQNNPVENSSFSLQETHIITEAHNQLNFPGGTSELQNTKYILSQTTLNFSLPNMGLNNMRLNNFLHNLFKILFP